MANRLIKKITAKLTGASTAETFDIYDDAAVHKTDVVDALTSTDGAKVLSAKQGKALNDSLTAMSNRFDTTFEVFYESKSSVTQSYNSNNILMFHDKVIGPTDYNNNLFLCIFSSNTAIGIGSMGLVSINSGSSVPVRYVSLCQSSSNYPEVQFTSSNNAFVCWHSSQTATIVYCTIIRL